MKRVLDAIKCQYSRYFKGVCRKKATIQLPRLGTHVFSCDDHKEVLKK